MSFLYENAKKENYEQKYFIELWTPLLFFSTVLVTTIVFKNFKNGLDLATLLFSNRVLFLPQKI